LVFIILKCCVDFLKKIEIGFSSFGAKMQKVMKETRNRKKVLDRPDRLRPSRSIARVARRGGQYAPLAHSQPSRACLIPDFSFSFRFSKPIST
jgi:hypothetical protein